MREGVREGVPVRDGVPVVEGVHERVLVPVAESELLPEALGEELSLVEIEAVPEEDGVSEGVLLRLREGVGVRVEEDVGLFVCEALAVGVLVIEEVTVVD